MKAGTIIKLPDGREATVVYHGLDGYGIKWGRVPVNKEEIEAGDGNTVRFLGDKNCPTPAEYRFFPEAMLREPYSSASLPCVGEEFEVVEEQL